MFRATKSCLNRISNTFSAGQCELNIQSIRWRRYRRPVELGTSKSKLFRIPVHKHAPPEEAIELQRISAIYKTQIKSLYAYYRDDKRKRIEASEQKPQSIEDDADFERVYKINEDWNREVAKIREARLTKERREMKEQIERNLEEQLEWEEEQRRITNELVLREKEAAKSFIVRENFDEALDAALEKKSNFNYAIDRDGKIIPGREYVNINKINQ